MKTLFIPAYSKAKLDSMQIIGISKQLPNKIFIAYTVQYQQQAIQIRQILSKAHKITGFVQTLGCFDPRVSKETQAILLIADGRFHAVSLAHRIRLPIYTYNMHELHKVSEQEVENLKKQKKASYVNYLNANKVGILISTKPGQNRLKEALTLKSKLKNKMIYFFIANNISAGEFENFNIDCWINTACPRLDFNSSKIININELK